jgi:N-acetylglutamate synthase-like GNAT family acetyltransferase
MKVGGYTIGAPESARQLADYFDLRWRVLRAPWGQPRGSERDEHDDSAEHCVVLDARGHVIGAGRLHVLDGTSAQIRYMAVEPEYRGCGVGRAIASYLEASAHRSGARELYVDARESAAEFYSRMGYEAIGPAHTLFGEIAHVRMKKALPHSH